MLVYYGSFFHTFFLLDSICSSGIIADVKMSVFKFSLMQLMNFLSKSELLRPQSKAGVGNLFAYAGHIQAQ